MTTIEGTVRALDAGWYLTHVSRVAHFFEPWDANDYFSLSKCGQDSLASSLWSDNQINHCKVCERVLAAAEKRR